MPLPRILVFASGSAEGGGSGFEKLVLASRSGVLGANIVAAVSNHKDGGVRKRAEALDIPFLTLSKGLKWEASDYQDLAHHTRADYFALSGWLKKVKGLDPQTRFNPKTVFNIHPGPLPEFGGAGFYGHHVHEALMNAFRQGKVTHSEVCMHFVDGQYDTGPVFFRQKVKIRDNDTPDSLGQRVNEWEHRYQAKITNMVVNGEIRWDGINPQSLQLPSDYSIDHFE